MLLQPCSPPPITAVLVEVVQDACALLECRKPLELCGAIRPVQELAALVPRMVRLERPESACFVLGCWSAKGSRHQQAGTCSRPCHISCCVSCGPAEPALAATSTILQERFIGDVCGTVFQRGLAHVPEALRQDNPADVPAILLAWIAGGQGWASAKEDICCTLEAVGLQWHAT